MKVLITGGTGFIGSRLALRSMERGHDVVILGQVNNPAEEQNCQLVESKGAKVVLGAVTDKKLIASCTEGTELVFHLAAAQHEANVPDQHFWDVNVEGTRNLLEASVQHGVKRFVHGSTIGVYGEAMEGEIDEQTALKPDNIYGVTKREGEGLALSFCDQIPVSVVRISETYGPGDRRLLKLFKAIQRGAFFMIGRGDNMHQLIYVDDLIDGMYQAAEEDSAIGEIFVLAGREVLTTQQMVTTISEVLGARPRRWHAPLWPFYVAAVLMEKTLRPLGIQPPLHRRRLNFFIKSFYFSQAKAARILDFHPRRDFREGVTLTAEWYRQSGLL